MATVEVSEPETGLPAEPVGDWEADCAVFVRWREAEDTTLWGQARWAYLMTARYGRATSTELSKAVGCAGSTIRGLVAAYKAFPDPAQRARDLSFSHHRRAALTADPAYWLDQAVIHGWSVRDLEAAIAEAKEPVAEAVRAVHAAEQLERDAKRWNARFAAVSGRRARVVWEEVEAACGTGCGR